MQNYLIAHDLGTSGDKASLLASDGTILRTSTYNYPVQHTGPGFAEQDPLHWWEAFCKSNHALLDGLDAGEVAGISLTGQMMCCLPLGRDGEILHSAIIWADLRASEEAAYLEGSIGAEQYYQIVGMRASPNYSLPKIMWLKKNMPEVYQKTFKFLSPKDYLNWRLTGEFVTDMENAAYMHCLDWRTSQWSDALIAAAGIDAEKLPDLLPATTIIGSVLPNVSGECALKAGTPVVMGTGDGGAATLGAAVLEPGEAYTSLGTSSWVCAVTGTTNLDSRRSISKLNFLDTWRDSGTMQAGGYSYAWMQEVLCGQEVAQAQKTSASAPSLVDQLAGQSPPGANGVLYRPYLLGERAPYWDTKLRASFHGISGRTCRADLCRSVMEGVALHLRLILDTILQVNAFETVSSMKMVGGGAKSPLWRQIFADIYSVPIHTTKQADQAGVLGVAVLTGVGLGMYPDVNVIRAFQTVDSITYPVPENVRLYEQLRTIFIDSQEALTEIDHRLASLYL